VIRRPIVIATAGFALLFAWLLAYAPLHHGYLAESDLYEFFLPTFLAPITHWSPFEFGGMPAFADPGDPSFYPFHLIARVLGLWTLVFVAAGTVAAVGMYAYVFALTRSTTAAVMAGLAYGLSEALMERFAHVGVLQTMGWFPWIALAIDRARGPHPWRWMALGGAFIGCCFLAGNPQTFLYGAYMLAAYGVVGAIADRPGWRAYAAAVAMAPLALLIAAIKLLPVLEASNYTARQFVGLAAFLGHSNTPAQTLSILFPTILHEGREAPTYVGIAALVFAVVAAGSIVRNWRVAFWWVVVCLGLLVGMGGATSVGIYAYSLPFYSHFRVGARHLILAACGLAALTGLGIGDVVNGTISRRAAFIGVSLVAIAIAAATMLIATHPADFDFDNGPRLSFAVRVLNWGIWQQLIVAAAVVAAAAHFIVRPRSRGAIVALVVVSVFDLVNALPYEVTWAGLQIPWITAETALNPSVHAAALEHNMERLHQRLLSIGGSQIDSVVPGVFARVWHIPIAGGYSPMLLASWFALTTVQPNGSANPVVLASQDSGLDLGAVRYVLVHPNDFRSSDTVERDGLMWTSDALDLVVGPRECGGSSPHSAELGIPPDVTVSRIAFVVHMRCAEDVPQGSPATTVTITSDKGSTTTMTWRAGNEIADERVVDPDVGRRAKHPPAHVFEGDGTRATYRDEIDLAAPSKGARIQLTVPPMIGRVVIDRVTAVDGEGHSHPLSAPDLLLAVRDRWQPAASFRTSRTTDRGRDENTAGEEAYDVFENTHARPLAWLTHEVVPLDPGSIGDVIHSSQFSDGRPFDGSNIALVDAGSLTPQRFPAGPGSVAVQSIGSGNVQLTVDSNGGFLVLSEAYYPGWRAEVDGRPVPVYPTDTTLQGIVVPAGNHRIRFVFASTMFRAGAFALAAGMVIVAIVLWRTRERLT
jgi:hypothetical protein